MKKSLIVLSLLLTTFFAKADQLAALTRDQAEKAVAYLKKESTIILWCSCCENETMNRITVNEVFMKADKNGKYYSVVVKGRNEDGKEVEEYVDLAYVFVKKGKKAQSLGKVLKFKCDPCTDPFSWDHSAAS
jgi:hypothetical protein